jgi:hypothetical protein
VNVGADSAGVVEEGEESKIREKKKTIAMRLRCGLDSIRGTAITYAASGVVVGHVAEELTEPRI